MRKHEMGMGETTSAWLRRPSVARHRLVFLGFAALLIGCVNVGEDTAAQPQVRADDLRLGQWYSGTLHCAKGHCSDVYVLDLDHAGVLEIEACSPVGSDMGGYDLLLLGEDGQDVLRVSKRSAGLQRIQSPVAGGHHEVRIRATGGADGRVGYAVLVNIVVGGRPGSRSQTAFPVTTPASCEGPKREEPVTSAHRTNPIGFSKIASVEKEGETVTALSLYVNELDGRVRVGMWGQLWEAGAVIAEFEIIEVRERGFKARILGELRGKVSRNSVAEIYEARPR